MNNNFKFIINCIIFCIISSVIVLFLGYYSDRLVSGGLLLLKSMVWLTLFYPNVMGVVGDLTIILFKHVIFFAVFCLVISLGFLFNILKTINVYNFTLGLLLMFFINIFLFTTTYNITNNLSVFMCVKYSMLAFIVYFVFNFRSLYFLR